MLGSYVPWTKHVCPCPAPNLQVDALTLAVIGCGGGVFGM